MTTVDGTPAVVIHDLDQAVRALKALPPTHDAPAVLISAPGAVASLGAAAFAAIETLARQEVSHADVRFVLDCADERALAVDAFRHGVTAIRLDAPETVLEKVQAIAAQHDAALDRTTYDLFPADTATGIDDWAQALKDTSR